MACERCVWFLCGLLVLALAKTVWAEPIQLYVAENGKDTWSGSLPTPNEGGTDGPFATLHRAQAELRVLAAYGDLDQGAAVRVSAATYYLRKPLFIEGEDSGRADHPIVYRAQPGGTVRLVGGQPVTGFKPWKGKILQCDLEALGLEEATFSQLFFRSERQTLARWPNKGDDDMPGGAWTYVAFPVQTDRKTSFGFHGDRPKRWSRPEQCQVSIWPNYNWWQTIAPVKSVDLDAATITLANALPYTIEPGRRYFYQNLLDELDAPGEWYHDRPAAVLYFWPPERIRDGDVIVPTLDHVIRLENAKHVTIHGFTIECTNGDAVRLENCEGCLIAGNIVRNSGSFGIAVTGGTNVQVTGNDVYGTGRGGIVLSGGDRKTLTPANHVAANNHIHHFGELFRTYQTAVNISGVGNRVAHNLIHDAPHIAILLGGNEHIIEYNEIHHVCLQGSDNGGFYMGRDWTQRGNVIRYNKFHDIYGFGLAGLRADQDGVYHYESPHQAWAVYLDDCSSGVTVYGNLFYRVPLCGVMIGGGRDNKVENNVFVDCIPALHIDDRWDAFCWDTMFERLEAMNYKEPPYAMRYPELLRMGDDPRKPENNTFVRNIVVYRPDDFRGLSTTKPSPGSAVVYDFDQFDPKTTRVDYNVIHHYGHPVRVFYTVYKKEGGGVITWDEWQAKGFDEHSLVADPLFVDPDRDDYCLKEQSAALAFGFKPIPTHKIGLYRDELRASAPPPPDPRKDGWEHRDYPVTIPEE